MKQLRCASIGPKQLGIAGLKDHWWPHVPRTWRGHRVHCRRGWSCMYILVYNGLFIRINRSTNIHTSGYIKKGGDCQIFSPVLYYLKYIFFITVEWCFTLWNQRNGNIEFFEIRGQKLACPSVCLSLQGQSSLRTQPIFINFFLFDR